MKREICKVFNWSAVGGRRRLLYRLRSQRVSAASAGETVGCMLQLQPRPLRLINLPTYGGTMSDGGGSSDEESASSGAEWPVTAGWLEAVLTSHHSVDAGAVQVKDFRVRPGCDAGESVLSDILSVRCDYLLDDQERSLSLIVKLLPHEPFSRYFVTEAQFDLREIKFYTQVVPELEAFQRRHLAAGTAPLQLPIPKCYHARYVSPDAEPDPDVEADAEAESVLVLEDLKARGFRGADFSRGLTLRQAHAALEAVARLHALALALKVREGRPLDARYPFLFQTARATDSYQQLLERGLPQLAAFLERRPGLEAVLAALLALRPRTKDIIAALLAPEEPLALITHTDFWCNNLLFRDEDCECAVLDWQMVTYSRPTNDVALLVVSSLGTELRRQHSVALLDGYWSALTGAAARLGVDVEGGLGYSRERLAHDYRRSQLLALLLCIGSVDVALGDPLTEQRLLDVLQDLHADGVLTSDASTV